MQRQVPVDSTAEAYIELLAARGIDYFFANGGTDFGPIAEAYAKRLSRELPVPRPVTVPHEITAVAMAHGYTMVTGRPQVVMVHTIAGTANATGGLINASRTQIPMLFSAGRTPTTESGRKGSRSSSIHWAQESFDQGAMVREWVKWDYELRPGVDLEGVVDRALALASTEPQGPVYLTLPREVIAEEHEQFTYSEHPRMTPPRSVAAPDAIQHAARVLAQADNPVAITQAVGKDVTSVPHLIELAEMLNLPIFDGRATYMNFPYNHRLHQPALPGAHLQKADVILTLESEWPWAPGTSEPHPDATVISVGPDALFSRYPLRSFQSDITLAGSTALTLQALAQALRGEELDTMRIRERGRCWEAAHAKIRADLQVRAASGQTTQPLDKAWVSARVEQVRTDNTLIINELGLDVSQFGFEHPGTYFGTPAPGVLGWGLGAALGAKLASPDKTVIACIGDGSYMFGSPTAAHWVARSMRLPVLFIVWNNAKWNAVASATHGLYPEGWTARLNAYPFSDLSPSMDWELVCQAAGGYGERVEEPGQVPAALERALHAVQHEKRQALLNMVAA